jgi:hypothetical protein
MSRRRDRRTGPRAGPWSGPASSGHKPGQLAAPAPVASVLRGAETPQPGTRPRHTAAFYHCVLRCPSFIRAADQPVSDDQTMTPSRSRPATFMKPSAA